MRRVLSAVVSAVVLFGLSSSVAFAHPSTDARGALSEVEGQGTTTTSLSGVVTDSDGGLIPGATVVVKDNATNRTFNVVTNSTGVFSVAALGPGTYTVTVSLSGFKTVVISNVVVVAASPASVKAVLEVGSVSETITVRAGTELVQTQSSTVSTTIGINQITSIPIVTRNGSAFLGFLPGVDTGGGHGVRDSSVMGLPDSAVMVTLDGVPVQDNAAKSTNGFWANIHPKLDMVEQVTVSSAVSGADSSGGGSVQVRWVTRSGTNTYTGSGYEYFRHPSLNTNYWFNTRNGLPKNRVVLNQYGSRAGGPLRIPFLYDGRGKSFFFANYEEFRRPASEDRTRTILTPLAQTGVFGYNVAGEIRQVNVLELAGRSGQVATVDPTIGSILAHIRAATGTTGVVREQNDPNTLQFIYQGAGGRDEWNPTVRLDFNLTPSHRLTSTYNHQKAYQMPDLLNNNDPTFPGFANLKSQTSWRNSGSVTLRSTLSSSLVNEARFGMLYSPIDFNGKEFTADMFADQGGFGITFPLSLTSATLSRSLQLRNAPNFNLDDTVSWLKGNHSFQLGVSFMRVWEILVGQNVVPGITLGLDTTNDPANGMFSAANFAGASTANLNDARALYALLTGRVTQISGDVRLNETTGEYDYLGRSTQRGHTSEFGVFLQDAWRLSRTLTLNLGVRWQLQLPFAASNSLYSTAGYADLCGVSGIGSDGRCNLFKPGTLTGITPVYQQYASNQPGYHIDWNNIAPSMGLAWRPNVQDGLLRTLFGDPDQAVVRAGYSIAYNKNGIGDFLGVYGSNPGLTITANRSVATGNLVRPGESWPLLFRETSRLGPPVFAAKPVYPMPINFTNGVNLFDPNWDTPETRSWSLGFQRALTSDMALEVRYVGTRGLNGATNQNWNEVNIIENGFFDEFRLAMANLQTHIAAGCGGTGNACSFADRGAGTSPLPIYLAYLTGRTDAGSTAAYTGTNWTNSTIVGRLAIQNPNPQSAASDLFNALANRNNATAAGLAANFFVMNPDVGSATINRSVARTRYDSVVVELRRRMSRGLDVQANYTYGVRSASRLETLRRPLRMVRSTDGVPHALKFTANYDVPVGRGRRFGPDMNAWLNGILGGWLVSGTGRVQTGSILNFGNVRVVGMSVEELQRAFRIRIDPATKIVYTLPQDIIDNTIKAFGTSATSSTGYGALGPPSGRYLAPANGPGCIQFFRGDCAPRDVFVTGPTYSRIDASFKKRFPFAKTANFELEYDVMNLFNTVNFNAVAQASSNVTINQVTSAYTDVDNTFDPGGRLGQIVFRINW